MSTYRPLGKDKKPKTPYWHYDFRLKPKGAPRSERFHGSTGQRTKKAADRVEAKIRELAALGQLGCTMTIDQACQRYWDEKLIHSRSADDQATVLETVKTFYGADTMLVSVDPDMVAEAAARFSRAPIRRYNRRTKQVEATRFRQSPSSVNRMVIEPMRRLLRRAKKAWKLPIDLEQFDWGALLYEEPAERDRELSVEEEARFWPALRDDYQPICEMYIISGRRRSDWVLLPKSKVDRTAGTAKFPTRKRKQSGEITVELTERELQIINEEWAKAPECPYVFTYEVQHGRDKGKRRPITPTGLRRATDMAFAKAGIEDFRRHDFRHTFGARAGRAAQGDPFVLMRGMDHQDIGSTARYRGVLKTEVTKMRSGVQTSRSSTGNVISPDFSKGAKAPKKQDKNREAG